MAVALAIPVGVIEPAFLFQPFLPHAKVVGKHLNRATRAAQIDIKSVDYVFVRAVHHQVDRVGTVSELKTKNARREVLLMPALARMLREHRLASVHSQPEDYVFTRADGRPAHPDTVRKYGLQRAVKLAGLDRPGKTRLRFHDLRHTSPAC